jgi:hypothetical protein
MNGYRSGSFSFWVSNLVWWLGISTKHFLFDMEIFPSVGQFLEMRDMYPPRLSTRVSPHLPASSQNFKEPALV